MGDDVLVEGLDGPLDEGFPSADVAEDLGLDLVGEEDLGDDVVVGPLVGLAELDGGLVVAVAEGEDLPFVGVGWWGPIRASTQPSKLDASQRVASRVARAAPSGPPLALRPSMSICGRRDL